MDGQFFLMCLRNVVLREVLGLRILKRRFSRAGVAVVFGEFRACVAGRLLLVQGFQESPTR